jgi:hypothetical protein
MGDACQRSLPTAPQGRPSVSAPAESAILAIPAASGLLYQLQALVDGSPTGSVTLLATRAPGVAFLVGGMVHRIAGNDRGKGGRSADSRPRTPGELQGLDRMLDRVQHESLEEGSEAAIEICDVVPFLHEAAARAPHVRPALGMINQYSEAVRQSIRVGWGHQEASPGCDDVAHSADVSGQDGKAGSLCLQEDCGRGLGQAWQHKDV